MVIHESLEVNIKPEEASLLDLIFFYAGFSRNRDCLYDVQRFDNFRFCPQTSHIISKCLILYDKVWYVVVWCGMVLQGVVKHSTVEPSRAARRHGPRPHRGAG